MIDDKQINKDYRNIFAHLFDKYNSAARCSNVMFGKYIKNLPTRHPVCSSDHNYTLVFVQFQSHTIMLKFIVQTTNFGSGCEASADIIQVGS